MQRPSKFSTITDCTSDTDIKDYYTLTGVNTFNFLYTRRQCKLNYHN